MTNNQFYLHSSPEGVIKLIEGDKMPVKPHYGICETEPRRDCFNQPNCLCAEKWKPYREALELAKEQAVTVADQEKALNLMWRNDPNMHNPISFGDWKHAILKPDSIYGPFSLRYEIQHQHSGFGEYLNSDLPFTAVPPSGYCSGTHKVAILYDDTPEKEPDFEVWASEYAESFKTGEWFENIRKEAYLHALQRLWKFTITRK